MSLHIKNRKNKIITIVLCILFIFSVLFTAKVTERVSRTYLNGDVSADLLLGNLLSKSHEILSKDWYYSNEPLIYRAELIFSLLFHFISDWTTVRVIGTLILQTLLVLSFTYMMIAAGQNKNKILLGNALLLLPFSMIYAKFILYHIYYTSFAIIGFMMAGFFFSFLKYYQSDRKEKAYAYLFILLVFAYISSLQGLRMLISFIIPFCLIVFCHILRESLCGDNDPELLGQMKRFQAWLIPAVGMLFAAVLGYVTYVFYIMRYFSCHDIGNRRTVFITAENLMSVVRNIFLQFGYRNNLPINSPIGMLSVCCVFSVAYFFLGFVSSARKNITNRSFPEVVMREMMFYGFFCVMLVNLMTNDMLFENYLLPSAAWIVPMICSCFDLATEGLTVRRCLNYICVVLMLANGILNNLAYLDHPIASPIRINAQNGHIKQSQKALEFIESNGYTYGLADHWYASVITELTDGLPVSSFVSGQ